MLHHVDTGNTDRVPVNHLRRVIQERDRSVGDFMVIQWGHSPRP